VSAFSIDSVILSISNASSMLRVYHIQGLGARGQGKMVYNRNKEKNKNHRFDFKYQVVTFLS
jgi:hypothetical protein